MILGLAFIIWSIGFNMVYQSSARQSRKAMLLIIIYALGECIISGIFRADRINGHLTGTAIFHDLMGGAGVIALLLLPLTMMKLFTKKSYPFFYNFSWFVLIIGIISIVLFSFRVVYFENTFLNTYKGIWQRIFLIDNYLYFITIAVFTMVDLLSRSKTLKKST